MNTRHFQTDNSRQGNQEMFNENWKTGKTTEAQQTYAETLNRFDDNQLEQEYVVTMNQISDTYQGVFALPLAQRSAAMTQAQPTLDSLATYLHQILTEANSRRQWPVPVNNTLPNMLPSASLKTYRELVNAMDEAELETELQSCVKGVDVAQETVSEILANNDGDVEGNSAFEVWSHTLKIRLENLQAVKDEIAQRQENAKAESIEQQREETMNRIRIEGMISWLNDAGDLTEIVRTAMSLTLNLASNLPTEGRYGFGGWRYEHTQETAQGAEDYLMSAYQELKAAVENVEWAIRRGDTIRGMWTETQKPDEAQARRDELPF